MKFNKSVIHIALSAGLIGLGAYAVALFGQGRKLGEPGIKTTPIEGSVKREIFLPDQVLDYQSEVIPTDPGVTDALPSDTSIAQRVYLKPGERIQVNTVLMGSDRTSIHKPQYCIQGAGWKIESEERVRIPIPLPEPYELEAVKMTGSGTFRAEDGTRNEYRVVLLYWFVEETMLTAEHWERMWAMAKQLINQGELQRWAFINCLGYCHPGMEEATFQRLKDFLADAVPQFQLAHGNKEG